MTDLQTLFRTVDALTPEELNQLAQYVDQRRHSDWFAVRPATLARLDEALRPVQEQAAGIDESDVNAAIDQALAEVRRERK